MKIERSHGTIPQSGAKIEAAEGSHTITGTEVEPARVYRLPQASSPIISPILQNKLGTIA